MTNNKANQGKLIHRGNENLLLEKVTDRFAVRLKRGKSSSDIARRYHSHHNKCFHRQHLDEFSVSSDKCDEIMDQLRASDDVEFATHVYHLESDTEHPVYITDEVTIQFQPDTNDQLIEALVVESGLNLRKKVLGLVNTYVFHLTAQSHENPIKLCNRLLNSDAIIACEPNLLVETRKNYVPTDELFKYQWHLDHDGGPFLSDSSHVDAIKAWDIEKGQRSVIIAVIDDSIDVNHRDFQGEGKIVAPVDFLGRDFLPLPEAVNDNHGTACAGVAVAEENGNGVVGIAPGCALMPIRMGGIDDNSIEEYFSWAVTNGASVISCSWGPANRNYPLSIRQRHALNQAATQGRNGKGCIIVFASGNSNRPVNDYVEESGWPGDSLEGSVRWYDGFASFEKVICVSACSSLGGKAAYSNWGKEITLCAPSSNSGPDTYPKITTSLPGWGVVTTDRIGPSGYSSSDYTGVFGGTSSACPLVAGIAGLIISANPELNADDVRQIMIATTDKITDDNSDPQLGHSFGDYDENGHSLWFGYGKINAFNALSEAVSRKNKTSQTVKKSNQQILIIPDNDREGVKSTIKIPEQGIVSNVLVNIDLQHTYIGDLQLALISPSGKQVTLHNRQGGRTNNIQRRYSIKDIPAFINLSGEPLQGDWHLIIYDLAAFDTGQLNTWELIIDASTFQTFESTNYRGLAIPDNDQHGIDSFISCNQNGVLEDISVSVDITHSYIGDLLVTLKSSSGEAILLHSQEGWEADNIIKTYSTKTSPELSKLINKPIQGDWVLNVSDNAGEDIGKLNQWSLVLIYSSD